MSSHPSSANDVFAKPKRPVEFHRPALQTRGHDMPPGKQKKYLQLKEKIIGTDELIQKYRQKVKECEQHKQQLKEVQTKLSIEEKGRKGLLAELSVLHQESKALQTDRAVALAEIERLQLSVKEEEMVREQLVVQLNELKGDKETSSQLREVLATTKLEMEKYKRMYQKTKQEFEAYKAGQRSVGRRRRRTSEANSLPAPLISPPLSEAGFSPLSTCSLPVPILPNVATNSLATVLPVKKELSPIAARPPQRPAVPGFDPNADLSVDDGIVAVTKVDLLDSDSCDTVIQEKSGVDNGDSDIIIKNNDIISNANSKAIQSRPLVRVTQLSDDSDNDTNEDERSDHKIPSLRPRKRSSLDPEVPNNGGDKTSQLSQSDSSVSIPIEATLLTTATTANSYTSSSVESSRESGTSNGCKSEEQTSLSQELFGDFDDSLSHLSVSDSSSCCSQSSLGSVDDLADLLRSDTQLYNDSGIPQDNSAKSNTINSDDDVVKVDDTQLYNDGEILQDNSPGSNAVSGDATEERANADDLVQDGVAEENLEKNIETITVTNMENKSTSEVDNVAAQTPHLNHENQKLPSLCCGGDEKELNTTSFATQAVVHHQKSDTVELRNQNQTPPDTVSISDTQASATAIGDVPTVFLPKIEVEAAPADTASSEDSDYEVDVSFSTLFGDKFRAISPLPPSPFDSHICQCPSTPLSPLPPSPVERHPLSPLPQTPRKDLKSISPLPPSPISAQPAAISPIPPTPISLSRAHCEVSCIDSISPEEISRDSDTSPVQFDDAAPINVHIPKPCSLSISIHASSESFNSNDVILSPIKISSTESPSPKKGKLRVSETSPFSPLTFVLPSSVEASSMFDNASTTVPTNIVPNATESRASFPLRLLSTSAESVSFDCTPTTANSGTPSGTCTCKTSPSSLTRPGPASAETIIVPVFEAVPLPRSIVVAREAAVADDRKAGGTTCILPTDRLKDEEKFDSDILKREATHTNKTSEVVNGFEAEEKLCSDDGGSNMYVSELAGTTSLDVVADYQRNSDECRTKLSLQIIKTKENPGDLSVDSLKLDGSNTDQGTTLDELTVLRQTTRPTEPPNVKSEKKGRDDELTEVFGDVEESDLDLWDDTKPVSKATPLPDADGCTTRSPVEEGEVEDSSDEEGGEGKEEKMELIPPPIVKNTNESLQISGLPLVMSQQKRTAAVSIPHATYPQVPPLTINRTITAINRSLQRANNPTTETTFDDLLNTFCPKTRSGKKAATVTTYKATAKTNLLHSSPEKPTPLARLLTAARSKPKRTNQATKRNAAAFIGVQSISSTNPTSSLKDSNEKMSSLTVAKDQKVEDGQCESRMDGKGKRSVPKRFKKLFSTEEPASKRLKLEHVDSQPSEHRVFMEEDKANESGVHNSPPEATSPQNLPGYQLRTRNVLKYEVWPSRRRRTNSSSGNIVNSGREEQEPTRKRQRRTSSAASVSPEAKKKAVKLEIGGDSVVEEEEGVSLVMSSKQLSLSETMCNRDCAIENSTPTSQSEVMHTENTTQEQISLLVDSQAPQPIRPYKEAATVTTDVIFSSSTPQISTSPLPMTTSILADSNHLGSSSDVGDNDQPLMIGELESLLGDEVFEDSETSSNSLPPQLQPSSITLDSQSSRPPKAHVRKTDSATGQEEDQTPASSPKTGPDVTISKQIQSFSEQKTKATLNTSTTATMQVSLLSSPHHQIAPMLLPAAANSQSAAVGYGQSQHTPLPEYKPPNSIMTSAPQSSKNTGPPSSSLANLDDDVFSTSLPLLEKCKSTPQQQTTQSTAVAQPNGASGAAGIGATYDGHSGISLAQGALTLAMKSPLPLPHWLVAAMTRVQSKHEHCAASGAGLSKKKRGNAKDPIMRQRAQKTMDYILINLERLVCGHLHLSTILTMFTNKHNVPSPQDFVNATMKYLLTRYNPKIEHVVSVFHAQCDDIRGNPLQMCPLDSGFPPALLRPECQLVALFLQMSQLYPSSAMAPLLVEMNKAIYQAMLKPTIKFHKLNALGRILTAICRLQGDADRVLFLAFDLLKKPLTVNELPVIAGIASVWPIPLARRQGVKLIDNHVVLLKGLEQQALSYTLEVLVMTMMQNDNSNAHGNLPVNLHTLCQWGKGSKAKISHLTNSLIKLLQTSDGVYIVSPPPLPQATAAMATIPTPWHRPRPSVLAFHIVHCLRAIAHHQGWVWTNDTLIRAHLWPLLQQWNANRDAVRETTVVCAVRLIGFISQQGLTHDPASSSVGQLQRVFVALLNKSDQISFPVQLAAVDSLLELCPPANPRTQELVGVVGAWLKHQSGKPHGAALCNELGPRLQALTAT